MLDMTPPISKNETRRRANLEEIQFRGENITIADFYAFACHINDGKFLEARIVDVSVEEEGDVRILKMTFDVPQTRKPTLTVV